MSKQSEIETKSLGKLELKTKGRITTVIQQLNTFEGLKSLLTIIKLEEESMIKP